MTLIVAAQQIRKALKQYGWSIQDDHHASDSNSHYFRAERDQKTILVRISDHRSPFWLSSAWQVMAITTAKSVNKAIRRLQ